MTISDVSYDILRELINIGVGKAAGALNKMTKAHVTLQAPDVRVLVPYELRDYCVKRQAQALDVVKLKFDGGLSGVSVLQFTNESGNNLVELLLGQSRDSEAYAHMRSDTLQEVGNVLLIYVMSSIGSMLNLGLDFSPLSYGTSFTEAIDMELHVNDTALLIKANFVLEEHFVGGEIIAFFGAEDFKVLMQGVQSLAAQM